jgi:hypothetical protein
MSDRPLFGISFGKGIAGRGRIYIEQGIYTSVGVIMIRFPRNTWLLVASQRGSRDG